MNTADNLRKLVLEEDSIAWQNAQLVSDNAFWTMNTANQVKDMANAAKEDVQMWMLFWAEYFDTDGEATVIEDVEEEQKK